MNNQTNRIPSLDGLRAVSIFIVVFGHIWTGLGYKNNFYLMGNLGVRIFFVISGFLITSMLINEFEKNLSINLKHFYFRRIFRIFPAYFFFLGVLFCFTLFTNFYSPIDFLYPFTYTSNYFFSRVPLKLGHTWSLAVEEQFYLIFPLVLSAIGLLKFKKFVLIIILVTPFLRVTTFLFSILFGNNEYSPIYGDYSFKMSIAWNFHTNMDILATGCLLALYRDYLHKSKLYQCFLNSRFVILFLVLFTINLGIYSQDYILIFYVFGMTLMNFSIMLCIDWLIVNHSSLIGKFLNLKPIIFIGVLSYSVYLWQQLFVSYSELSFWTHLPNSIILIFVCALFSYYLIEKPFSVCRKKLEKEQFFYRHIDQLLK